MKATKFTCGLLAALGILLSLPAFSQPSMPRGGGGGGNYRGGGYPGGGIFPGAGGNSTSARIRGTVVLSGDTPGAEEIPGNGVVVQVIRSLKEKKYTVAGENGNFMIWGITPGQAIVSFSMMGYESIEKVVDLVAGENKVVANLKPVAQVLEGAVIKEYVNPVSIVGDTVIFKASAVKTEKGEMAIDILEQMPGVEITENGIKVMNEQVKNVYIDGALLFGDAPMRALQNLAADDVTTIKSYQEYANKDPNHKISKNEEKQRVLDVQTKSKPKFVKSGDFIAGGGFDTDSTYHKFRYTLGANASFFSEKLVVTASANVNNINNSSNRVRGSSFMTATSGGNPDLRNLSVNLSATKKWMSPTTRNFVLGSIGGSYGYHDSYNVTESITKTLYFPGEEFNSREVDKISTRQATSKTHSFSLNGMKALKDGEILLNNSFSLKESLNYSWTSEKNIQDDLAPQGNGGSNKNTSGGNSFATSLNIRKGFADKWRLSFEGDFSRGVSDAEAVRKDTLLSTLSRTELDIKSNDSDRSLSLSPRLRYEVNDNLSLSLRYTYDDDYSVSEHLSFDVTNPSSPVEDPVNTRTWTTDRRTNRYSFVVDNHFDALDAILRINAAWKEVTVGSHESYPDVRSWGGPFRSAVGSVRFGNESTVNHWELEYSTSTSAPSVNQIDPNIDNDNIYSVSVGNPNLSMTREHQFVTNFETVVGSRRKEAIENEKMYGKQSGFGRRSRQETEYSTLAFHLVYDIRTNPIVSRQTYYKAETYLPEYDYTMPAQSTLSSYENAPESRSLATDISFGTQIRPIMCIFNARAGFSWDSSPSYVKEQLTRTVNMRPSMSLGIRSNFSRRVRLNLGLRGEYNQSRNDQGDESSYFVERINFGGEVNRIFNHIYVGGNYFKQFTQGMEYGKFNDNILNLRVGGRFGPKNQFDVSVSANDVFNTTTGFSTSMNANYVRNTWNHQFGRYVMLTLAYRFNQGGGGRGMGGPGGGGPRF